MPLHRRWERIATPPAGLNPFHHRFGCLLVQVGEVPLQAVQSEGLFILTPLQGVSLNCIVHRPLQGKALTGRYEGQGGPDDRGTQSVTLEDHRMLRERSVPCLGRSPVQSVTLREHARHLTL
jgi:hypothetical protein